MVTIHRFTDITKAEGLIRECIVKNEPFLKTSLNGQYIVIVNENRNITKGQNGNTNLQPFDGSRYGQFNPNRL